MEFLIILFVLVACAAYWTPTIVAASRHCENTASIAVLNGLLGWTLLGWAVSLAWAVKRSEGDRWKAQHAVSPKPQAVFVPQAQDGTGLQMRAEPGARALTDRPYGQAQESG
jgi:hypothetical protein